MGRGSPHGFAYENIGIWDPMCQNPCVFTHFLKVPLEERQNHIFERQNEESLLKYILHMGVGTPPNLQKVAPSQILKIFVHGPMNVGGWQRHNGGHGVKSMGVPSPMNPWSVVW